MSRERSVMSVNSKGKIFILLFLPVLFLAAVMEGILLSATSFSGVAIFLVVVAFLVGQFLLNCPDCGKNIFARLFQPGTSVLRIGPFPLFSWSVPWPERTCSECGTDLTIDTIARVP
ncbi:MAG: hypothetical protein AAGM33_03560 [Pseudomonadota bacterium]